jgi:hypothetical protein
MSSDDSSGTRPAAPIVLRIKLRYDDVDAMVQRFATNVGKSGLFLPTRSLQPIGAEIKFELRLADDTPALVGLGRVKAATPPDANNPRAAFGMAIELMRVTPQSRAVILRMLEHRKVLGLPELGLPLASDIDAARRAEAAGAAREPSAPIPVVPVDERGRGAPVMSTASRGPGAPHAPHARDSHPGEALLTAPRRTTGPLPIAKVLAVAPLAPEPPRRKRVAVSEVIESASGPVVSVAIAVPGIDDDIDIAAALVRARSLAGTALDAELDALAEIAAAPLEISIEAASAELARQLGGSAVRRDRSARWVLPPATTLPAGSHAGAEPATEPAVDPGVEPATISAADVGAEPAVEGIGEPAVEGIGEPPAERIGSPPAGATGEHEVAPEPIADEIHRISDGDMEDIERTEMGDIPGGPTSFEHGFATEPSVADQLVRAVRLDEQLADAEAEADADDRELARALGIVSYGAEAVALAGSPPFAASPVSDAEPPTDISLEEIDDFEILAEADASDEDLLSSHGEHDASLGRDAIELLDAEERLSSELDFASRLDLGDESDLYYSDTGEPVSRPGSFGFRDELADSSDALEDELRLARNHVESARQALAAFDTDEPPSDPGDSDPGSHRVVRPIFDPDSSRSFTLAGAPGDAMDLDVDVDTADPLPIAAPRPARAQRATQPPAQPVRAQRPTQPPEQPARAQRATQPPAQPARAQRATQPPAPLAQPARTQRPTQPPAQPARSQRPTQPPAQPARAQRPTQPPGQPARAQRPSQQPVRGPSLPQSLLDSPVEDHELEHALEALDVDLDDLAIPHAATQLQRDHDPSRSRPGVTIRPPSRSASSTRTPQPQPARATVPMPARSGRQTGPIAPVAPPAPARPAGPRVTTDDGVMIDFDDDE